MPPRPPSGPVGNAALDFSHDVFQRFRRESHAAVGVRIRILRHTCGGDLRNGLFLSLNKNRHAEHDSRDERIQFHDECELGLMDFIPYHDSGHGNPRKFLFMTTSR